MHRCMARRSLLIATALAGFVLCITFLLSSSKSLQFFRGSPSLGYRSQVNNNQSLLRNLSNVSFPNVGAVSTSSSTEANSTNDGIRSAVVRSLANLTFVSDAVHNESVSTGPIIINSSLVSVENNFIGGWVVKGNDIVASALFAGGGSSHSIILHDAWCSALQCSARQDVSSDHAHRFGNIVCPFSSVQDMSLRMRWHSEQGNNNLSNASDPQQICESRRCSFANCLAFTIDSKYFDLMPIQRFPASKTAVVLPVIFGNADATMLHHWLAHTSRVVGADTVVVYSSNSQESFDQNGRLKPFYSSNVPSTIVIVNMPQIQNLHTHYHSQQFIINDALQRSIGAVDYLGSFDADEFLEFPASLTLVQYLRAKFCNNADTCGEHKFAALGIGSLMIDSYSSNIDQQHHAYFCSTGLIHNYSYLPSQAECFNDMDDKLPPELCVGWRGRRKWFVAIQEIWRIHSVDIHHIYFQNGGTLLEVPAFSAHSSVHVTDMYIRHYRSWLPHVCKHYLSPSLLSLKPSQNASGAKSVADLRVYVTFAACGNFKMYYNGELFLQSDILNEVWKVYGAYVTVARGGIFSVVLEGCLEKTQFIGCFGSSVCTGLNENSGWICSRQQPPSGWMSPSFISTSQPDGWEIPSNADAIITSSRSQLTPRCLISDINSTWSYFEENNRDRQCLGLSPFPSATNITSCSLACCANPSCMRFQWCSGGDCNNNATGAPRCWIGSTSDCQRQVSGWVSGLVRKNDAKPGWQSVVPTGEMTTFRTVEVGLDKRARWIWPLKDSSVESQMYCRWSIQ